MTVPVPPVSRGRGRSRAVILALRACRNAPTYTKGFTRAGVTPQPALQLAVTAGLRRTDRGRSAPVHGERLAAEECERVAVIHGYRLGAEG